LRLCKQRNIALAAILIAARLIAAKDMVGSSVSRRFEIACAISNPRTRIGATVSDQRPVAWSRLIAMLAGTMPAR